MEIEPAVTLERPLPKLAKFLDLVDDPARREALEQEFSNLEEIKELIAHARDTRNTYALRKLLARRTVLLGRERQKRETAEKVLCDNPLDPFSQRDINELDKLIIIEQNGKTWCFELVELARNLFESTENPFTRKPFSTGEITRVLDKAAQLPSVHKRKKLVRDNPTNLRPEIKFSFCEEEIVEYMRDIDQRITAAAERTDPGYLDTLQQLCLPLKDEVTKRLKACKQLKYPRQVLNLANKICERILLIFP